MQLNCTIVPVETINKFRHLHCAGTDRFIFPGFLLRRLIDWVPCSLIIQPHWGCFRELYHLPRMVPGLLELNPSRVGWFQPDLFYPHPPEKRG